MSFVRNTAGQNLGFGLIDKTSGNGLTGATVTTYRVLDGGTQATATGTVAEKGNGQYNLAMSQADTDGAEISFLFVATGAIPCEKTIVTTADAGGGSGSVTVDHDTGGADNLSAFDGNGVGIDGVEIRAYLATEWAVNPLTATVRGRTWSVSSGHWSSTMALDPDTYTFVYSAPGYAVSTKNQVVS